MDVSVHTESLDAGAKYDLALLQWSGGNPQGTAAATFCHAASQNHVRFNGRGFPQTDQFWDMVFDGAVKGSVTVEQVVHWQIECKDIRSNISGAPLYNSAGRVLGLVRKNCPPTGDLRNTEVAWAIQVASIFTFIGTVPELEHLVRERERTLKGHAEAERRLDAVVSSCLSDADTLVRMLAQRFLPADEQSASQAHVLKAIKDCPILDFADNFMAIESELKQSGDTRLAARVGHLYCAILAQILNRELVEAKRAEIAGNGEERGVILIPCPDRAVLELLMAGIDGRAAVLVREQDDRWPRGRNEIPLDDLPEGGIEGKPDELAKFLRRQLRLDPISKIPVNQLPARLRIVLKQQRKKSDCVFAVINGYSEKHERYKEWPEFRDMVGQSYPEILLVDMMGDSQDDEDVMERYYEAGSPFTQNALFPESQP